MFRWAGIDQGLRPAAEAQASDAIKALEGLLRITLVQMNHFAFSGCHNAFTLRQSLPCWQPDRYLQDR
jgi:hypothetical protein